MMESAPDEILATIFSHLDINDRQHATQVCRHWNDIFTCHPDTTVGVVNIFEGVVWHCELSSDLKDRFSQWLRFDDLEALSKCLVNILRCEYVKIWFASEPFVEEVLALMNNLQFTFKGLDLYPYKDVLDMRPVIRLMPEIDSVTIRPHGKVLFNVGVNMDCDSSGWTNMSSLALENVSLAAGCVLPSQLTELEWSPPRSKTSELGTFLVKVRNCPQLQFLSLSHADFLTRATEPNMDNGSTPSLVGLLHVASAFLPDLLLIGFKFCKFKHGPTDYINFLDRLDGVTFKSLKAVKFDLCYDEVVPLLMFLVDRSPALRLVSYECILSKPALLDVWRFLPTLKLKEINLKFSILQRQNSVDSELNEITPELKPPDDFAAIICRFDMSFVTEKNLVSLFFNQGIAYPRLTDFRAIRCPGMTDAVLGTVASSCPNISKLQLNGCNKLSQAGLQHFVDNWSFRRSKTLKVILPGTSIKLTEFHDSLNAAEGRLFGNVTLRCQLTRKCLYDKTIRRGPNGEMPDPSFKLVIWEPSTAKTLILMDYPPNLINQILGFIVGKKPEPEENDPLLESELSTRQATADILTILGPVRSSGVALAPTQAAVGGATAGETEPESVHHTDEGDGDSKFEEEAGTSSQEP